MPPGKGYSTGGGAARASAHPDILQYRVELHDGDGVTILAYAAHASLAQSIYGAAKIEYPAGVIVLCRGEDVFSRSNRV